MRLVELVENQKLIIQLLWGEQKIEFFSEVIDKDDSAVYVSPYLHNGSELELNVVQGKDVICNIFTNDPTTEQRISWNNVELTTIVRNGKMIYCLKTNGYNYISKHTDRRKNDRLIVHIKAKVFDGQSSDGVDVIVHDISDIGISFYAPKSFSAKAYQLKISFSDIINEKIFDVNVTCIIARTTSRAGNQFIGCKIMEENKDYRLYCFLKHLDAKNKNKIVGPENIDVSENEQIEEQEELETDSSITKGE